MHFTAKGAVVTITAEATVRTVNGGPVSRQILEHALEDALRRQLLQMNDRMRSTESDLLGMGARAALAGWEDELIDFAGMEYRLRTVLRDPCGLLE